MVVLRRPCGRSSCKLFGGIVLVFLLIEYQGLAFRPLPSVLNPLQQQQHTGRRILSYNGGKIATLGSTNRCTNLALTGNDFTTIATSGILESSSIGLSQQLENGSFNFGNLVFGVGFLVAIGAYVFANVVYTPEILQGAKDLRLSERETEIRKILQAIERHEGDLAELKVPLEAALGKPLEDYVRSVLEDERSNSNDSNGTEEFSATPADKELAIILKRNILQ